MQVKLGYKQTEVGVIPQDWKIKPLGDLTILMTNGFVGTATRHYADNENGILYIQGYNVEENSFNFHGIKYVTDEFHKAHMKSCLRCGDLLTVQTGDVGLTTIVPESLAGSNCHALIISRFNQASVFSGFISFYLNSNPGRSRLRLIETGTTMKHLNVGDMLHFNVPLPPTKPEQEAIAEALSDADALIESLKQLLAKKRQIKQGAMQDLLSGKKRLPGFSGEWGSRALGTEIVGLDAGVSVNSTDDMADPEAGTAAILKTSCVDRGVFKPWECKLIATRDLERATLNPRADTILISRMNTIELVGECGYVDASHPYLFVPDRLWMTRFRKDALVSAKWLSYVLSSEYYRLLLKGIATGTSGSMKNIAKHTLLSLIISFPLLLEQNAIATILSDMDTEIATLEAKLAKARQIKQGMMQELLTGRIRLV